ncbi:MAG: hypothetical protein R2789_05420 [Microthrixaceae bacterium]
MAKGGDSGSPAALGDGPAAEAFNDLAKQRCCGSARRWTSRVVRHG